MRQEDEWVEIVGLSPAAKRFLAAQGGRPVTTLLQERLLCCTTSLTFHLVESLLKQYGVEDIQHRRVGSALRHAGSSYPVLFRPRVATTQCADE